MVIKADSLIMMVPLVNNICTYMYIYIHTHTHISPYKDLFLHPEDPENPVHVEYKKPEASKQEIMMICSLHLRLQAGKCSREC